MMMMERLVYDGCALDEMFIAVWAPDAGHLGIHAKDKWHSHCWSFIKNLAAIVVIQVKALIT
jgi:hypothetical protein